MSFIDPTPAERAMMERVNQTGQKLAAAVSGEDVKVVAVAISIWFEQNPELSKTFEALCQDWLLPLTLKNVRSIHEGDRALKEVLRRVR